MEDIEILENLIKRCDKCDDYECRNCEISWVEVQAIKRLVEKTKEFYNGEICTVKQLKSIEQKQKKYFVNKQVIVKKIEEINNEENVGISDIFEYAKEFAIEKLKELLNKENG